MEKGLIAFVVIMGIVGCSRGIDLAKFEDVHKAAKDVEAATVQGVSKDEFGSAVKRLAIELARLEKKPLSAGDKKLYDLYVDALLVYDESYGFWDTGYREFDPNGNNGLALVMTKYGVPTEPVEEKDIVTRYENNLKWMRFDMIEAKGAMDHEMSLGGAAHEKTVEELREVYERKLKEYNEQRNNRERFMQERKRYVRMDGDKAKERMWIHGAGLLRKAFHVQETGRLPE